MLGIVRSHSERLLIMFLVVGSAIGVGRQTYCKLQVIHSVSKGIFLWCAQEIATVTLSFAICSEFEPRGPKKNKHKQVPCLYVCIMTLQKKLIFLANIVAFFKFFCRTTMPWTFSTSPFASRCSSGAMWFHSCVGYTSTLQWHASLVASGCGGKFRWVGLGRWQ